MQVLYLSGANRPGLLTALSAALRELGLDVSKAIVETDAEQQKIADKFYVTKQGGGKVTDSAEVANIKKALEVLLKSRAGPVTPRPKFTTVSIQQDENKRELLYTLMGGYCWQGRGRRQRATFPTPLASVHCPPWRAPTQCGRSQPAAAASA